MVQEININTTRDQDPSRTITLRRQFIADFTRRFRELKRRIRQYLVTDNNLEPITVNVFEYTNSVEKLETFQLWLAQQERELLLETVVVPGALPIPDNQVPWANTYLDSAYQKGIRQARADLTGAGIRGEVLSGSEGLFASFNAPVHASTIEMIYTRNYNELRGITDAMDQQISRVLAQGMTDGLGVQQIARNINNRVDAIGLSRARTLARTEVVHTFNTAALRTYQGVEDLIGEDVYVKWWTARDDRVRPRHRVRHGKIYLKEDAVKLIGEPNCRCSLLPYVESVEGEVEEDNWGPVNTAPNR